MPPAAAPAPTQPSTQWTRTDAEALLDGPVRGERLKRARLLFGAARNRMCSQHEMAQLMAAWLGETFYQSNVSRHELGERVPSPLEYAGYAAITGQPIEWLAFGVQAPPVPTMYVLAQQPGQPAIAAPFAPSAAPEPAAVPPTRRAPAAHRPVPAPARPATKKGKR